MPRAIRSGVSGRRVHAVLDVVSRPRPAALAARRTCGARSARSDRLSRRLKTNARRPFVLRSRACAGLARAASRCRSICGHVAVGLQRGHDRVQMLRIAQVHIDQQPVEIRLAVDEVQVRDIGLLLSDQGADPPQHAGVVADRQIQRDAYRPPRGCPNASAGRSSGRAGPRSSASAAQSMACTTTPLPRKVMPTIRSPGSGWQQGARSKRWPGGEADRPRGRGLDLVAVVRGKVGIERAAPPRARSSRRCPAGPAAHPASSQAQVARRGASAPCRSPACRHARRRRGPVRGPA